MTQPPRVDFQLSDQSNYVFPTVKRGDLLIKMSTENAGFHVGSLATSNVLLSMNKSVVQFTSNMSLSNDQVLLPPGTASAPAMAWSNDKQTGLFRSAAGAIAFVSSASNIATFSSNITLTSVAIGKALNPVYTLDIAGTANFTNILINGQPLSESTDPSVSNVAYPTSNIAFAISNTVFTASNIAFATSTPAFTASNAAFTASNAAFTASNIAYAISNIAYPASTVATAASNVAFSLSNVAFSTISLSNIGQTLSPIEPITGSSANVSVPSITMKYVPSNAKVTYGRVELGAHSNISLATGASMTVRVTHNLATTNYLVFASPESAIDVACSNYTADTFDVIFKNVSGDNIANPAVNYQLVQAATSNVTTTL